MNPIALAVSAIGLLIVFGPQILEFFKSKIDFTPSKEAPAPAAPRGDRVCILDETLDLVKRLPPDSKNRELIINKVIPELVSQELKNEA